MDSKEIFSSLNLFSNTYFFILFFFYLFIFFLFILHLLFIFIFHFCGSAIRIFWNTQSFFPFIYFLHSSSFSSLFSFYFPFSFPLSPFSTRISQYFSSSPSISLSNFSIPLYLLPFFPYFFLFFLLLGNVILKKNSRVLSHVQFATVFFIRKHFHYQLLHVLLVVTNFILLVFTLGLKVVGKVNVLFVNNQYSVKIIKTVKINKIVKIIQNRGIRILEKMFDFHNF